MKIELRPEEEKDYRIVEELTREAFWDIYTPGTDVHLLVHNLRKSEGFVKDLDFVAVYDNKIAGNIVYAEAEVSDAVKRNVVLTFGPLSVLPEYQNRGIGTMLIRHTMELAGKMGYKAIIIYGDPGYYKRFGFRDSKEFNITNKEGKFPAALLALELYPNALHGVQGVFDEGKVYEVDEKELEEFDKGFIKKEKSKTAAQDRFIELSTKYL